MTNKPLSLVLKYKTYEQKNMIKKCNMAWYGITSTDNNGTRKTISENTTRIASGTLSLMLGDLILTIITYGYVTITHP